MLTRLDLHHFKCFETLKLPLAPLTLLSGSNASGKSSALQSLVLLHQTLFEHEWSTRLMLNGYAIRLGTLTDVVDQVNGRNGFSIGIADEESAYRWAFKGERQDMSMSVESVFSGGIATERPEVLRYLLPHVLGEAAPPSILRLRGLTYITAERVGPREIYTLQDRQAASVVGPAGEHAASVLEWGREEKVLEQLVLDEGPNTRLHQVEKRMRMFFPGCGMELERVAKTNSVRLGLRTSLETSFLRPIHVGFGLTQIFPIIVAALSAKKADLLLIENPEVHLHPARQALMGQFLADVAQAGVQVILETHSDHVLNGVRRSVKSRRITPEQVAIHFFKPRSADLPQVISPQIDPFGNINEWPAGFFDQFDKDMNYFAGWGE